MRKKNKVLLYLNINSRFFNTVSNNKIEFEFSKNLVFYVNFQGVKLKAIENFEYYEEYGNKKNITRLKFYGLALESLIIILKQNK